MEDPDQHNRPDSRTLARYLASSCGSGQIRIFNTSTGKQAFTLHNGENVPTTQVRGRDPPSFHSGFEREQHPRENGNVL